PATPGEEEGIEHLLRRYLAAFGPARPADAAGWAGVPPARMRETAERLELRGFRDGEGKPLVDLPPLPLPAALPPPPPLPPPRPPAPCPPGTRRCSSAHAGRRSCPSSTGSASFTSATRSRSRRSWSTGRWPGRGASSRASAG